MSMNTIHYDDSRKLSLNSVYFDDMRNKLDIAIKNIVYAMEKKGVAAGSITLKIDCTIDHTDAKDFQLPMDEVVIPHINYKLNMKMQHSIDEKGNVVGAGFCLAQDALGDYFVIPANELNGQTKMFDSADPEDDDE